MTFETELTLLPLILLAVAFISALCCIIIGLRPMRITGNHCKRLNSDEHNRQAEPTGGRHKASIVVYTHNDEESIAEYLDSLLRQDYPDFEIIMVNDASADNTASIIENYTLNHQNVYMTFVPSSSHSLSRRKMALTLGIKAANGEVIITTAANCKISSDEWLTGIMRHFDNEQTDVVLGYSHIDKSKMKGLSKWYRSFDSLITATQWLGAALDNKPYRGDGFNLAFRKHLFFEHKGYAQSVYLQYGDDDLFINEIADTSNTKVELDYNSQLTVDWGEAERRLWLDQKEHYSFTSRYLKTNAFRRQRLYNVLNWLALISLGAVTLTTLPNLFAVSISLSILLLLWSFQIFTYRRAAKGLQSIRLWWSVPLFTLLYPIVNTSYKIKFKRRKSKNFTWQRPK